MAEIYYNGQRVTEDELDAILAADQDFMEAEIRRVAEEFGVSLPTASAIVYLRSRSRHTPEKENELIERDHAGNPIPLSTVLSGEF